MPSSGSKVWEAGELLRGVTTCENNVSGRFQFDILQEERVESPHPINTWRAIGVYINRWQPNSLLAGPAAYFWFPIIISWWWLWGPFGVEHSLSDCVNFNVDVLFMTRSSLSLFNSRSRLLWVSPVKRGHLSIRATPIADLPVDTSKEGRGSSCKQVVRHAIKPGIHSAVGDIYEMAQELLMNATTTTWWLDQNDTTYFDDGNQSVASSTADPAFVHFRDESRFWVQRVSLISWFLVSYKPNPVDWSRH